MSDAMTTPAPMSAEDYLAWHVRQDERYDYVDGVPRLKHAIWDGPRLTVGATQAHTRLCFAVARELDRRLPGGLCRVMPPGGKVVTPRGNHRYPDVAVDCGPFSSRATALSEPRLIVEVWSKSTRWIDLTRKLDDYRSVVAVETILFLSQDACAGQLWSRGEPCTFAEFKGREAEIPIPALGLTLPLEPLYDGLDIDGTEAQDP